LWAGVSNPARRIAGDSLQDLFSWGESSVRKVSYSMSVSLDGFIETPHRGIDWVIVDEELHTFFNEQAREMGAFLYGRRIYELLVDFWPTADADPSNPPYVVEYAHIWKDMPKIVFSKTLDAVEWNSGLVREGLAEEIRKLKAQPGKELSVGGPTLASTFMQLGLIDEYGLFVNPIVLGGGTPFFPALHKPMNLQLIETRRFRCGVVYLRYQPVGGGSK
jgi:dihydrofolate reductase